MDILNLLHQAQQQGVLLFEQDGKLGFKVMKDKTFSAELKQQVIQNKDEVLKLLIKMRQSPEVLITAERPVDGSPLPLSFSQQRLWFIEQLHPGRADYNIPTALWVHGQLDLAATEYAMSTIIQRHEVLRTVYRSNKGEAQQVVLPEASFKLAYQDLSMLAKAEQEAQIEQTLSAHAMQAFDLVNGPVVRAMYLHIQADAAQRNGMLLLNMHHIASDGWSRAVFIREFVQIYSAYRQGQAHGLADLSVQYADFALWQRKHLASSKLQQQLDYWGKHLEDLPLVHGLPLDHARPAFKQSVAGKVSMHVSEHTTAQLKQAAQWLAVTPFVLLHGAFALVLSRHSYSQDIVVGTAVANRRQKVLDDLIGFFVNTLVLRTRISRFDLAGYFADIHQVNLDAQSNQDVPFEQLVERMQLARTSQHTPLFQIMFAMTELPRRAMQIPGLAFEAVQSDQASAKFDLELSINLGESGLDVDWTYDVSIFAQASIERLNQHLQAVLLWLGKHSSQGKEHFLQQSFAEVEMFNAEEMQVFQQLLDSSADYGDFQRIEERFAACVSKYPQHIALIDGDLELSYAALAQQAAVVSAALRQHGVAPEHAVGLAMHRSADMIVAMLAILQLGACYVPLNPAYPHHRLQHMAQDSQMRLLLSHRGVAAEMQFDGVRVLDMQELSGHTPAETSEDSSKAAMTGELAYLIYTSGTTGQPKGVMGTHKGVLRLIHQPDYVEFAPHSRFLHCSSISFDAALLEIWGPLLNGGAVVLYTEAHVDIHSLNQLLAKQAVSGMFLTSGLFMMWSQQLAEQALPALRDVITGGDVVDPQAVLKVQRALPSVRITNGYGPTENTTFTSCYTIRSAQKLESVPIGRAITATGIAILDQQQQFVPPGCIGELYTCGAGLALGYLHQAALTAEKFPTLKLAGHDYRMYRTGDLVQLNRNGDLEFMGRQDGQVKIRGFRIELSEVKRQIDALDCVASCLITVTGTQANDKQLVAYIEQTANGVSLAELRQLLASALPPHMLPAVIIEMTDWPLTANGKIDQRALPTPEMAILDTTEYRAPSNEIERQLVLLWGQMLQIEHDKLSIDVNFFETGGHSLLAVRLADELRNYFLKDIKVSLIFEFPTIATLAQALPQQADLGVPPARIEAQARTGLALPLSFAQQRLWIIDQIQGASPEYNMPMAFEITGEFDAEHAQAAFQRIVDRHEILRTVYAKDEAGEPVQHIRPQHDFALKRLDLTMLAQDAQPQKLAQILSADARQVFDLSTDLMIRACWVQCQAQSGVLLCNMHHIASDGWSVAIILREFVAHYQAIAAQRANNIAPLALQYADYANWQRQWLQGDVRQRQVDYWLNQLQDLPAVHTFPLDYPRPAIKQWQGARVSQMLPAPVAQATSLVAASLRLTPFMLMHGMLALVLSRHSASDDIVVGIPSANRSQTELAPLIGFFINTLILRTRTDYVDLSTYFAQVRQVHLDAQSHQDLPFDDLVRLCNINRSSSYTPLFQIMFSTDQDFALALPNTEEELPWQLSQIEGTAIAAKFDLDINLSLTAQGLKITCLYDVSLFSQSHIEQLTQHLCNAFTALATWVDAKTGVVTLPSAIDALPILSDAEITQLLQPTTAAVQAPSPSQPFLQQVFENYAQQHADEVALVYLNEQYSFGQLNSQANQLAHMLREQFNIRRADRVGICTERSIDTVLAILAVLKAGAAYVPLDPHAPAQRLEFMLADASISLALTQGDLLAAVNVGAVKLLQLERVKTDGSLQGYPRTAPDITRLGLLADDLAYVIYTSGSTGQPKGVMVEHGNLAALASEMLEWFPDTKKVGWCANYVFDASLQGLLYLMHGRALVIIPDEYKLRPVVLQQYLQLQQVDLLDCTPGLVKLWLDLVPNFALPHLLVGGEALSSDLWSQLANLSSTLGKVFYNVYGPTECTVNSTVARIQGTQVSIGRPLSFATSYVCALAGPALVPYGAIGELYIGGAGVARGYVNLPELSAERFIANPFQSAGMGQANSRLYRSGDLVRYLPDGQLEYLGRTDDQLKIRGFRIETAEIEAKLLQCPLLDSCLVAAEKDAGEAMLIAYVHYRDTTAQNIAQLDHLDQELRAFARQHLPQHMLPADFVLVDTWPLTRNGKINKQALAGLRQNIVKSRYVAPQSKTEQWLAGLWSRLLSIDEQKISAHDNFFSLGGHSLLIIRLLDAILRETKAASVGVSQLINCADLRQMASLLEQAPAQPSTWAELKTALSRSSAASAAREALIIVPAAGLMSLSYANLAAQLALPAVAVIEPKGMFSNENYFSDFEHLIADALSHILQHYPDLQHYHLLGHSFGGTVAFELALRLQALGKSVSLILAESLLYDDAGITSAQSTDDYLQQLMQSTEFQSLSEAVRERFMQIYKTQSRFLQQYRPAGVFHGKTTFVYGQDSEFFSKYFISTQEKFHNKLSQAMLAYPLPGEHFSLLAAKNASAIVKLLRASAEAPAPAQVQIQVQAEVQSERIL